MNYLLWWAHASAPRHDYRSIFWCDTSTSSIDIIIIQLTNRVRHLLLLPSFFISISISSSSEYRGCCPWHWTDWMEKRSEEFDSTGRCDRCQQTVVIVFVFLIRIVLFVVVVIIVLLILSLLFVWNENHSIPSHRNTVSYKSRTRDHSSFHPSHSPCCSCSCFFFFVSVVSVSHSSRRFRKAYPRSGRNGSVYAPPSRDGTILFVTVAAINSTRTRFHPQR